MSLSPDQHQDRAAGLAASEFAAILGLDPYKSPLDVWLAKTGRGSPDPGNTRTKWGTLLEPTIREDYAERHGLQVVQTGTLMTTVRYAATPPTDNGELIVAATPDGMVWGRSGLEIKCHSVYAADYGPDGSDEVPPRVAIQCQVGCFVTETPAWDVVAFYDGQPHDYRLAYDKATAEAAIEFGARWWRDHVVAHKAPSPDGSDATGRTIGRMFPGKWRDPKAARWLAPTDQDREEIALLRHWRNSVAFAKRQAATHRQKLEVAIGDADGFEWHEEGKPVRLSWRLAKDGRVTDYRAALADYCGCVQLAATALDLSTIDDIGPAVLAVVAAAAGPDLARYTTVKPGSRRFVVPRAWSKDPGAPDPDDSESGE